MAMRTRTLLGLIFLLSACGGKSAENIEPVPQGGFGGSAGGGGSNIGGGGTKANGGNAGASGSGGSAGAPTDVCPSSAPSSGSSACNYVGPGCVYPQTPCTSLTFTCLGGFWELEPTSDGAAYTCANYRDGDLGVPKDGDSCACRGQLDCTINECSTAGQVHAVCDNTSWHLTTTPCTDKPCGTDGLSCKPDEICVAPSGPGDKYNCRPNPCVDQNETTSCSCAGSLCSSFEICSVTSGLLSCSCPTCGF